MSRLAPERARVSQSESERERESARVGQSQSKSEPEPELSLQACINCSGILENVSMNYNKFKI